MEYLDSVVLKRKKLLNKQKEMSVDLLELKQVTKIYIANTQEGEDSEQKTKEKQT